MRQPTGSSIAGESLDDEVRESIVCDSGPEYGGGVGNHCIEVLLVDAQPAMRRGIRQILEDATRAHVIREAEDAEAAILSHLEFGSDIVILDPELGEFAFGLELCRRLKALPQPPRVLFYAGNSTRETVAAASLAGADGYLDKRQSCEKLTQAIEQVVDGDHSGGTWLPGDLGAEPASMPNIEMMARKARLTRRESEVLTLLIPGYTYREIAQELYLSRNTVKEHASNLLRKLGVKSRRELSKSVLGGRTLENYPPSMSRTHP